jgi:hypothetical protein
MAQNKTQPTAQSVDAHIAAIQDDSRRKDCEALARLMEKATGQPPKMWGRAIVGFGTYHYKYESGREGDFCPVGFSSRKGDLSVYVAGEFPQREALLAALGRHKTGGGCIYIRAMADVDTKVLQRLVAEAYKEMKRRHA